MFDVSFLPRFLDPFYPGKKQGSKKRGRKDTSNIDQAAGLEH
jgi:hypothetical protein